MWGGGGTDPGKSNRYRIHRYAPYTAPSFLNQLVLTNVISCIHAGPLFALALSPYVHI